MSQFTAANRRSLAASGAAMKDGSYPIRNATDLANAVNDYNRTGQSAAVKAHIVQRARALNLLKNLPESWNVPDGDSDADDKAAPVKQTYESIISKHAARAGQKKG